MSSRADWTSTWSRVPGNVRTRIRQHVATRLPSPCTRCGEPVTPGQAWDVDHITEIHRGGDVLDPTNHGPAHQSCNRSSGAASGNRARTARARRIRTW